ncbi:MAG: hypothetical protein HY529_04090 [Chloroflexi bacterium]|nr:hypothetical protein [Chloroflexota bacterium]
MKVRTAKLKPFETVIPAKAEIQKEARIASPPDRVDSPRGSIRRKYRQHPILAALVALSMLFSMPVAVNAVPSLPHGFYGTVKINNADAPVGTTIEARVPGVVNDITNPYVTIEIGKYGSANPLANKPRLVVQGDIAEGAIIEFFVNGVKASETAAWHSSQTTALNLTTGTSPAITPIAPTIVTAGVTDITTNSATIFGTLSSLGTATTVNVSFEYGITTGYGSTTPPQPRTAIVTFGTTIAGLLPGTLYHYRAKADGGTQGSAIGADMTFSTSVPGTIAPAVVTDNATNVTANSAILNGNLTSPGTATSIDVSFEWGTISGGPYPNWTDLQAKTTATTFTSSITGLTPNTSYFFRAKANGATHGTSFGTEKSFVTLATSITVGGAGGGGGGGASSPVSSVKLEGLSGDKEVKVDSSGKSQNAYQLQDPGGKLNVAIPAGTSLKNASGSPLTTISLTTPTTLPQAPSLNTIVIARELGPSGATFVPPLTLTLTYNESELPAGARETEMVIAYWDGSKWIGLLTTVNADANTAIAAISHFTIFGLLAKVESGGPSLIYTPAPPTTPASAPAPTVTPTAPGPPLPPSAPQPLTSPGETNVGLVSGLFAAMIIGVTLLVLFIKRMLARS